MSFEVSKTLELMFSTYALSFYWCCLPLLTLLPSSHIPSLLLTPPPFPSHLLPHFPLSTPLISPGDPAAPWGWEESPEPPILQTFPHCTFQNTGGAFQGVRKFMGFQRRSLPISSPFLSHFWGKLGEMFLFSWEGEEFSPVLVLLLLKLFPLFTLIYLFFPPTTFPLVSPQTRASSQELPPQKWL